MSHRPKKRFGQHFLVDDFIIQSIIAFLDPKPEETVVEVGPGQAALTAPLLERAKKLTAIEIDRELVQLLSHRFPKAETGLSIIESDALEISFSDHFSGAIRLVGNLPYNISTPLLFHFFEQRNCIVDMLFMVQKEVADRLAAPPGSKDFGRLSVMAQYYCHIEGILPVPPTAFAPPPKVDSTVIYLKPYEKLPHLATDEIFFRKLVTTAFSYRRKTLRNALKSLGQEPSWDILGIDPAIRPERLSVQDFVALSNHLS